VECCALVARDPNKSDVHRLIDSIDVDVVIEKSIVPSASELPVLKVTGYLPLLQVNFSDKKYRTLMNIIKASLPPSQPEPVKKEKQSTKMREKLQQLENQEAMGLRGDIVLEKLSDKSVVAQDDETVDEEVDKVS
jgi:vacuolar protein sorting-associated protein 13A/C